MRIGIKGKLINHNFYQAMIDAGYKTVAELSRSVGLTQPVLGKYLNLKDYPRSKQTCDKLELCLNKPIQYLFPKELYEKLLPITKKKSLNFYKIKALNELQIDDFKELPSENNTINKLDIGIIRGLIKDLSKELTPQQRAVLCCVLDGAESNADISRKLKMSSEMVAHHKSGIVHRFKRYDKWRGNKLRKAWEDME